MRWENRFILLYSKISGLNEFVKFEFNGILFFFSLFVYKIDIEWDGISTYITKYFTLHFVFRCLLI